MESYSPEENGDYQGYNDNVSDFKRHSTMTEERIKEIKNEMAEKIRDYIKEITNEKMQIERKFPIADRLLDTEIVKVKESGKVPPPNARYLDVCRDKPTRLIVKVSVPVREYPKFNFVGKLLGPKGNSLKRLQEDTMCLIKIAGRGSMKDHSKEAELRESDDPKYAHLNDDLHVEISALAPPAEAYARISYALAEVRKYLTPDSNDEIRQEQLKELLADPESGVTHETAPPPYKRIHHPRGPRPQMSSGHSSIPTIHTTPRSVAPGKHKVMSILNRARSAMEEGYAPPMHGRYEDPSLHYEQPYDYSYAPPTRSRYAEMPEQYVDYRREYREPPSYPAHPSSSSKPGRSSWKTNNGALPATALYEESGLSEHTPPQKMRDSRGYRNSPYSKPSKHTKHM